MPDGKNENQTLVPETYYPYSKGFNKFPSYFSPKEQEQLTTINRKLLAARQTMATWHWGERPAIEKGLRTFATWITPEKLEPKIGLYGLTPTETENITYNLQLQQQELLRQQTVSEDAQQIMTYVVALAANGTPIQTIAELENDFPQINRSPWTASDKQWIIDYMNQFSGIQKGEVTPPSAAPVTYSDVATAYRRAGLNPQFIASSVAMEKDTSEVVKAIRAIYEPQAYITAQQQTQQVADITADLQEWGFWDKNQPFDSNLKKYNQFVNDAQNMTADE